MKEPLPPRYVRQISTVLDTATKILKSEPELHPISFVINSETNTVRAVEARFRTEDDKDAHAEATRQYASRIDADAVVFISESWGLATKDVAEYERIKREYGELANYPGRLDQLVINLECREGIWLGRAEIKPAKKGRKIGPMNWLRADKSAGRFSNFLPVKYATPEQVDAILAQCRAKFVAAGIDPDAILGKQSHMQLLERTLRNAPADRLDRVDSTVDEIIAAHKRFYGS